MKKNSCSTALVVFFGLFFAMIIAGLIFSIVSGIEELVNNRTGQASAYFCLTFCYILFSVYSYFVTDENVYTVYYDSENNVLTKEGLIFNRKRQVNIEYIEKVSIEHIARRGECFFIYGLYKVGHSRALKKSFILLEKNEENEDFIREFWDKPFEDNSDKGVRILWF